MRKLLSETGAVGRRWAGWRVPLIDLFVTFNLAFLSIDIYMAHSVNQFHHPAEWIPLIVSIAGAVLMGGALLMRGAKPRTAEGIGYFVGYTCVAVGVVGMLLHLDSRFFTEMTVHALVYSAPFVAPLAYAGLGMLLIMNRMVPGDDVEWGRWVVFLACAGFFGNFGLSLADHAQNGFFHGTEWIPVITAAFAVGCLIVASAATPHRGFLDVCLAVMVIESLVGLAGFVLHFAANMDDDPAGVWHDFIFGAPVFAPLLFPNLALLAMIGLVDLRIRAESVSAEAVVGAP